MLIRHEPGRPETGSPLNTCIHFMSGVLKSELARKAQNTIMESAYEAFYLIIDSGIILSQKLCENVIRSLIRVLVLSLHQPIAKLNRAFLGCIIATKPVKVIAKFSALSEASAKAIDALRVRSNTVDVEFDEVEDVQEALLGAIQFAIDDVNQFGKAHPVVDKFRTAQKRKSVKIIFVSNRATKYESTTALHNLQARVPQRGLSQHNLILLDVATVLTGGSMGNELNTSLAQRHEAVTPSFSFTQQEKSDCDSNELHYIRVRNSSVDIECYFKELFGEILKMVPSSLKLLLSDAEIECDCQLVALNAFQGAYELDTPFAIEAFAQAGNSACASFRNQENYQLRVVSKIPLSQLSESVLIGRSIIIQPTQLWRFELDELIRNQILFRTLSEKLNSSGMALICEMKKPIDLAGKLVTLYFAVLAIQQCDFDLSLSTSHTMSNSTQSDQLSFQQATVGKSAEAGQQTMLIRQLLPRELCACPRNRIFLEATSTKDEIIALRNRFDALLRTIPRIEVYNPLFYECGLFDSAILSRTASATCSIARPGQQRAATSSTKQLKKS